MFAEKARDSLCQAVAYLGAEASLQSPSLRRALNDLCPGCREINLLVAAQTAGVPSDLYRASSATPQLLGRLAGNVVRDHFVPLEAAIWSVETWAQALGIPIEAPPEPPRPEPVDPEPPAPNPPVLEIEVDRDPEEVVPIPQQEAPPLPETGKGVRPWSALLLPSTWYWRTGRPVLAVLFALLQGPWFISVVLGAYSVASGLFVRRALMDTMTMVGAWALLWLVLALPGFLAASGPRSERLLQRPLADSAERSWNVRSAWALGCAFSLFALWLPLYHRFAGAPPWWEMASLGKEFRRPMPPKGRIVAVSGDGRAYLAIDGTGFAFGAFGPNFECLLLAGNRGARAMRTIRSGALSPDAGEAVLLLSNGANPVFYDVRAGVFSPKVPPRFTASPRCCAYSRDGKLLAFGLENGDIVVLDARTMVLTTTHRLNVKAKRSINAVAVSDAGSVLALAKGLGLVGGSPYGDSLSFLGGGGFPAEAVLALSRDGERVVIASDEAIAQGATIYRFNRPFDKSIGESPSRSAEYTMLVAEPGAVQFSDDGSCLLLTGKDAKVVPLGEKAP